MKLLLVFLIAAGTRVTAAFVLPSMRSSRRSTTSILVPRNRQSAAAFFVEPRRHRVVLCSNSNNNDDDDETEETQKEEGKKKENPYQDPNYPDLEFIDYSDPEYSVDQGVSDEFFEEDDDTEEQIEAMREERRRRNDEFQFETYFAQVLKKGEPYKGEWTIYKTNFEQVDANGFPRFHKVRHTMKVISKGYKDIVDPTAEWRVDGERIRHEEMVVSSDEGDPDIEWLTTTPNDDDDSSTGSCNNPDVDMLSPEQRMLQEEIMANTYWPKEMTSFDMRGQQGNMCVGNAYTICHSVPLDDESSGSGSDGGEDYHGPFRELRTEIGIQSDQMRFRVKLDYRIGEENGVAAGAGADADAAAANNEFPPLNLRSLIVCRESLDMWPRDAQRLSSSDMNGDSSSSVDALFGNPGASGGLYDPPPVGCKEQSGRYMLLDLDGGATLLFPHTMDQDPDAFGGNGWVTSLDWTPGRIRYQVDRKVDGGRKLMGLRTLELSEVQGADADLWRPRDGGQDMRQ